MAKKCLLLGGAGFIGKNLAAYLLKNGYKVGVYDAYVKSAYTEEELNQIEYYEREFFTEENLEEIICKYDVIIHLISSVGPENSMINPQLCYSNDVAKTVEVLEIMRKNNIEKMIFISSGGTVYGNAECESFNESMPLFPKNHYGITKVTIEKIIHMYNEIYGMNNTIVRISNPYGMGQQSKKGIGAVTVFAEKILNNQEITIWGDGSTVRDYIYIDDVVRMIACFIEYKGVTDNEAYNIGTGVGTSLNELIKELENQTGIKANVIYESGRKIDVKRNVLNMDKTFAAIGNKLEYSLHEGIKTYLKIKKC